MAVDKRPLCLTHQEAFELYKMMDNRSLANLRRLIIEKYPGQRVPSPQGIHKWSQVHHWEQQIGKFDTELRLETERKLIESVSNLRHQLAMQHYECHSELLATVQSALAKLRKKDADVDIGELRQLTAMMLDLSAEMRELTTVEPHEAYVAPAPAPSPEGDPLEGFAGDGFINAEPGERMH